MLLSAFLKEGNAARYILNLCLSEYLQPIIGNSIFNEYEDIFTRDKLFLGCPLNIDERRELLDAFYSVCKWQKIHYLWRPNLHDESDNHVLEIAIAADVKFLITQNKKDFLKAELLFPNISILNSAEFVKLWKEKL